MKKTIGFLKKQPLITGMIGLLFVSLSVRYLGPRMVGELEAGAIRLALALSAAVFLYLISKEMAPLIYIKELADSSVNFSCEVYVGTISNRKLTLDYLCTRTLSEFRKAGIEIPFNQLDVNVKTLEKEEFIEKLKQGLFSKNGIDDSKVLENTVNSKI